MRALQSPREIGARYGVNKGTVLAWYHQGVIPAEVVVGRVFRFCPVAVERALKAHKREQEAKRMERLPGGGALVV